MRNNINKFSDSKQSTASKWVENILRVVLYSQRKMSAKMVSKRLERSRKINENYTIPLKWIKRHNLKSYNISSFQVAVFNNESIKEKCIMYLHGGGFVDQPLPFHYSFLGKLAKETGLQIHLPIYPKSPEFTFLQTMPFVFECYKNLLTQHKPENIYFIGDSAGATIALALAEHLKIENTAQPKHIIMLSPCFDLSLSIKDNPNNKKDPMFYNELLKQSFAAYSGSEKNLTNYLASPEFGDFTALAPLSIFIGTKETLYPYAVRFMEKAKSLGVDATCYKYHNLLHVFPMMPIPEALHARDKIKEILQV